MKIIPKDAYLLIEAHPVGMNGIVGPDGSATNAALNRFIVAKDGVGEGRLMMDGTRAPLSAKAGDEVILDSRIPMLALPGHVYGGNDRLYIIDAAAVMAVIERDASDDLPRLVTASAN